MNNITLSGRVCTDITTRTASSGTAVASYRIAVPKRFKRDGDADADFFNCVAFGKGAEFASKYLRKGIKIIIEGELHNDNYQNKEGNMVYRETITVRNHEFAESKNASGQGGAATGTTAGTSTPAAAADNGFMNVPDGIDEDLPFN